MSYDLEKALITKVLETQDLALVLKHHVSPEYVSDDDHRQVFEWVISQYEKHGQVPSLGLLQEQFADWDPEDTDDSLELVIESVKEKKLYGDLQAVVKQVASEAAEDPSEALSTLQNESTRLSLRFSAGDAQDLTQSARAVRKHYRWLKKAKGVLGIPWPWDSLTRATGGIRRGSFNVFYASPGTYKTWLLILVAMYAHEVHGKKPLFFTSEMPPEDIRFRWACLRARVDWAKVQLGELSKKEERRFYEAVDAFDQEEPFILDELSTTGTAAIAEIRSKVQQYNSDFVLIDGLAFAADDIEWKEWDRFLKELKRYARKSRVPIVATHHSSKDRKTAKKGEVDTLDVALGDSLFRHVDVLIRLWRSEKMKASKEISLTLKKAREGQDCSIIIHAKPAIDFGFKYEPEEEQKTVPQKERSKEEDVLSE